jgi:iron complex outermembrane receptor protein
VFQLDPDSRTYSVSNVFVQHDITLAPRRLFATLGTKWERNAFSGGELQPSVRGRLALADAHLLWGGVSRATRSPTRFEADVVIPGPAGPLTVGSDDFVSESLVALEAGYRLQPARFFSAEIAAFRHRIANLRSVDAPLAANQPAVVGNSLTGRSHGIETSLTVQPRSWWRTHVGYTWLDTVIERAPGSRDLFGGVNEANDPHHLLNLMSSVDLPHAIELDVFVRSVGALPRPSVPAFTELRLRAGWRATARAEVWIAGEDLLHDRHVEFAGPGATTVAFERAVRAGVTLRY